MLFFLKRSFVFVPVGRHPCKQTLPSPLYTCHIRSPESHGKHLHTLMSAALVTSVPLVLILKDTEHARKSGFESSSGASSTRRKQPPSLYLQTGA